MLGKPCIKYNAALTLKPAMCEKQSVSPPIDLNRGSVFVMWDREPLTAQQKNKAHPNIMLL